MRGPGGRIRKPRGAGVPSRDAGSGGDAGARVGIGGRRSGDTAVLAPGDAESGGNAGCGGEWEGSGERGADVPA